MQSPTVAVREQALGAAAMALTMRETALAGRAVGLEESTALTEDQLLAANQRLRRRRQWSESRSKPSRNDPNLDFNDVTCTALAHRRSVRPRNDPNLNFNDVTRWVAYGNACREQMWFLW
jgi:hypothetical protein